MNSIIEIAGVAIGCDRDGRYCLNDLQRAATIGMNARTVEVYEFMRRPETIDLVSEISNTGNSRIAPVITKRGNGGGTYVVKELVYAYAMWISPAFNVRVIRAFDALANGSLDEAIALARGEMDRQREREMARLEAPALTDAVRHIRKVQGKEVEHYHFSNEFDLINRIALGKSAKQFRAAHGIAPNEGIRDHLSQLEIKCITHLQRHNAALIEEGMTFEQRKSSLHRLYLFRYAGALACEVQQLEA